MHPKDQLRDVCCHLANLIEDADKEYSENELVCVTFRVDSCQDVPRNCAADMQLVKSGEAMDEFSVVSGLLTR